MVSVLVKGVDGILLSLKINLIVVDFYRYSIIDGVPADYSDKFEINPSTGAVSIKSAITNANIREYQLTIQVTLFSDKLGD